MATSEFDRIWEQVQSLTPEEQRELRERLSQSYHGGTGSENELDQTLVVAGILAPMGPSAIRNGWKPVAIQGEPLSSTLIQERR